MTLITTPILAAIVGLVLLVSWPVMLYAGWHALRRRMFKEWLREAGFLVYCTVGGIACIGLHWWFTSP